MMNQISSMNDGLNLLSVIDRNHPVKASISWSCVVRVRGSEAAVLQFAMLEVLLDPASLKNIAKKKKEARHGPVAGCGLAGHPI